MKTTMIKKRRKHTLYSDSECGVDYIEPPEQLNTLYRFRYGTVLWSVLGTKQLTRQVKLAILDDKIKEFIYDAYNVYKWQQCPNEEDVPRIDDNEKAR